MDIFRVEITPLTSGVPFSSKKWVRCLSNVACKVAWRGDQLQFTILIHYPMSLRLKSLNKMC